MKKYFNNVGYFLKEAKIIFKINWVSNIFSLFSTGLIFFVLVMIISSWWISNEVVEMIQEEAEVSVYFHENIKNEDIAKLVEGIIKVEGVREARLVDESEAYDRMVKILGKEARVLEFFDDNPFSSFIEVKIHLEEIDFVLEKLHLMNGIDYIRDNKEVLDRISNISNVLKLLGYLVIAATGITTVVIIAHIIRLGIYNNREQINTLRLLGAPELFIAFPYLLEGLLLTLGGGLLATILAKFSLEYGYAYMTGPLPFLPLPSMETIISNIVVWVILVSGALGIMGSLMGLSSAREE